MHGARVAVFGVCAGLVALGAFVPQLPQGTSLQVVLLLVGCGALGLFPCYYSLTQELSQQHLGKITGSLGAVAWGFPAAWHWLFGRWVDATKSYDRGMQLAALLPLVALVALAFWPREEAELSERNGKLSR